MDYAISAFISYCTDFNCLKLTSCSYGQFLDRVYKMAENKINQLLIWTVPGLSLQNGQE